MDDKQSKPGLLTRGIDEELAFAADLPCFVTGLHNILGVIVNDNVLDDQRGKVSSDFCDEMIVRFYFFSIFVPV